MTTHFTSHFRRPIGVLAGLSLLASLLVAVPGPIKAQDPEPDYLATFEACPEDIIPSSDFSDVSSRHENAEDIDCIAYYVITRGTSATTYSPADPVIREHMALFLVRLARLVGIEVPAAGRTPFVDISDLKEASQDAISQIYQLGITIGASADTYAPARNVSRGEMALFLKRLMNLIDPIEIDDQVYGYIPEDIEDEVLEDADVDSPYNDLQDSTFAVYEAVTQLYELGVGSGISGRAYGPRVDMSRAAMAEFMADILDHSNLRPAGVTVELTPAQGWEDFRITALISVRDDEFLPLDEESVDWFYAGDEDGGLASNGTCDLDLILDGDCEWEDDGFYETGDDGNLIVRFSAEPGATMTFYAWIGTRDGQEFDEDTADFSKAEARSDKGVDTISITSNIDAEAAQVEGVEGEGAYIVDLDRISAVTLRAQLEDEDGNRLRREGIEVEVDVERTGGSLDPYELDGSDPSPTFTESGSRSTDETATVLTDRNGVVTFRLARPARTNRENDRLDEVTFSTNLGDDSITADIGVAWSESEPVLVQALPDIDSYRFRTRDEIRLNVRYRLYDQYGSTISSSTGGRPDTTLMATLSYELYQVSVDGVATLTSATKTDAEMNVRSGRVTESLAVEIPGVSIDEDHLLVVTPEILSDDTSVNNEDVQYVRLGFPVWVLKYADDGEVPPSSSFSLSGDIFDINNMDMSSQLQEVEMYPGSNEFRTFFTMWEYDSNDRFIFDDDDDEDVTLKEFEELFESRVDSLSDIFVRLYYDRESRESVFEITPID